MFDAYSDIFEQRGNLYHQAMLRYPRAREQEFQHTVRVAGVEQNHLVCDVPSGGGYLQHFLEARTTLIHVETSYQFAQLCRHTGALPVCLSALDHLPLPSRSLDRVVSLAGLHHVEDKLSFYQEAARILKPQGVLCIADVWRDSRVATFLDTFVHTHNSMGHTGLYIDDQIASALEPYGFHVVSKEVIPYHWTFETLQGMAEFCQLLFGMDRATPREVLDGIQHYLGYARIEQSYCLNWELLFCKAVRSR